VDSAVRASLQDEWRSNAVKVKKVRIAIKSMLQDDEVLTEQVLELVKNQNEY
jgi:type I restriction enzyme, R subunit